MTWIDLHMHSNISSDGEFSPAQLMHMCAEKGIRLATLSDHNSVRGIAEAAKQAKNENIEFLPGVELDCKFGDVSLHVLGLNIDANDPFFNKIDLFMTQQERDLSQKFIEKVETLGIHLNHDELWQHAIHGIITPELIAEYALAHPKNTNNEILKDFRPGGKYADNPFVNFYWNLCAPGKAAHVPMQLISLQEAVTGIKTAGGVPILAHPGNNIQRNKELALAILQQGVKGFEVFSSYHNQDDTTFYQNLAGEMQCFITVGSDFHGKTKPAVHLGGVNCNNQEEKIYKQFHVA